MIESGNPPFGGELGKWNDLEPVDQPSDVYGYRVIPAYTWWTLVHLPWRQYVAARAQLKSANPPPLAPYTAPGVYFTDRESLEGLLSPSEYAYRVGLHPLSMPEVYYYGCVVIEFPITKAMRDLIRIPQPVEGSVRGLTVNGAREWIFEGILRLSEEMNVLCADWKNTGPRHYGIPL